LLLTAVLGAATLIGFQPNGPGFLGVFVAVSAVAFRLPVRLGAVVVAVAVAGVAVAGSVGGHWPFNGIVLDEVVGTAADGEDALALAIELRPDVVLMDLRMPRCNGVEATRRLREHDPNIKVLMLTTYADDRSVIDALRTGARGYLTKDAGAGEIRQALEQVTRGQAVVDPAVQHHLIDAISAGPPVLRTRRHHCPTLSPSEKPKCSH
jgi:CheY-like chemotaxis protein